MRRGSLRRLVMLAPAAVLVALLGGCYGVYSYGYYEPCPPPPPVCKPVYVVRPYCPPPVYVEPCRPVYRCGPRW